MNRTLIFLAPVFLALSALMWSTAAPGQDGTPIAAPSPENLPYSVRSEAGTAAADTQSAPVSYASVTQVNGLLSQLEATSKNTQTDLAKMRVERWKADGSYKKQSL